MTRKMSQGFSEINGRLCSCCKGRGSTAVVVGSSEAVAVPLCSWESRSEHILKYPS